MLATHVRIDVQGMKMKKPEETRSSRSCSNSSLQLQVLKEVFSINLITRDVGEGMGRRWIRKW